MIKTVIKTTLEVTGATTPVIPLGFMVPTAIAVEDAVVGTALTFNVGYTESGVFPLYNLSGTAIGATLSSTGAGVGVYALSEDFKGVKFLQIESNGVETNPIAITIYGYEL